jgi:hypothetical protein
MCEDINISFMRLASHLSRNAMVTMELAYVFKKSSPRTNDFA